MTIEQFLAVFQALNDRDTEYVLTGSWAEAMHGRIAGTDRIELVVTDAIRAANAIASVWPDASLVSTATGQGVLPPRTPIWFDLVACDSSPSHELLRFRKTVVRVMTYDTAHELLTNNFTRVGFSSAERIRTVQLLTSALSAAPATPRGVRKYRSFTDASADRDRWESERVIRTHAERATLSQELTAKS